MLQQQQHGIQELQMNVETFGALKQVRSDTHTHTDLAMVTCFSSGDGDVQGDPGRLDCGRGGSRSG